MQKHRIKGGKEKSAYWQLVQTAGLAAALFLILCAARDLFPLGEGSVLMVDLHSQYTPLLYRFYDVVTGLKNLFMDFSVSGGANLYADTINEVINPFNYLLLLFGRGQIYQAINVLLGAYIIAAAVSANLALLRLWPDRRRWNLMLSILYGFSGFAAYQFQIIKWMIFPVLFPLFVLAFLRLVREKKGGWYALLLAYQLALNLQLGAMTLFAVLFGSGLYFFFCVEKEEKKRAMCRLAVYTMLGVAASAAALWPGVLYLLTSARGGENGSYFAVMKQHGLDDLFERLFLTVHPVLLGIFGALAVERVCGFKNRRRAVGTDSDGKGMGWCRAGLRCWKRLPKEGKFWIALNLFFLLTVLAQPSNLLWHLGSYMCFPVRYGYMVLLAGICLAKWLLLERERQQEESPEQTLRAWHLGCEMLALLLAVAALYLTWQEADQITQAFSTLAISRVCPSQTLLVVLILGILAAAALLAFAAGKRKRFTMTVVACASGLCLFLFILLPQDYVIRLMNEDAYKTMNEMYEESAAVKQQSAEVSEVKAKSDAQAETAAQSMKTSSFALSGFSRVPDDEDLPLNAALITGEDTLTGYFPAGSQMVYAAGLEQLGYLTPWVSTRSWGGTMISDALLGVNKEETKAVLGGALVLEESAETLAEGTVLAAAEPLALQAYLGQAVSSQNVLEWQDAASIYAENEECIQLTIEGRQAVYLDAGYAAAAITVFVNEKEVEIPEGQSAEGEHRLLYLGTYADRELRIQVLDGDGAALSAESGAMKLGLLDVEAWEKAVSEAEKLELAIDRKQGTLRIDGSQLEAGQTLFVPVAAIDGWTCLADGEKVDITPIFGGFMGITLPEKANTVTLTFCPPGLKLGLIVTAAALLLLVIGNLWSGREKTAAAEKVAVAEKTTGFEKAVSFLAGCYCIAWCAGAVLIYVIPNIGMVCFMAYKLLAR